MNKLALIATTLLIAASASAHAETAERRIVLKNHVFVPAVITLAAGEKIKLVIENQDDTAEEFDSADLKREKIIPARSEGFVFIGPLSAGRYKFEGEFNAETAQGVVNVQ